MGPIWHRSRRLYWCRQYWLRRGRCERGLLRGRHAGTGCCSHSLSTRSVLTASHPSQCLNFAWTLRICMASRQQPMTPLTFGILLLCSLANNMLRAEGCMAVAAVLNKTQITSLKCASPTPSQRLNLAWALCPYACLCVSSL